MQRDQESIGSQVETMVWARLMEAEVSRQFQKILRKMCRKRKDQGLTLKNHTFPEDRKPHRR